MQTPCFNSSLTAHLCVFKDVLLLITVYVDPNCRPFAVCPTQSVNNSRTAREDDTQTLEEEQSRKDCVTHLDVWGCTAQWVSGTWCLVMLLSTGSVYSKLSAFSTWKILSSTANLCFTKDFSQITLSKSAIIPQATSMSTFS